VEVHLEVYVHKYGLAQMMTWHTGWTNHAPLTFSILDTSYDIYIYMIVRKITKRKRVVRIVPPLVYVTGGDRKTLKRLHPLEILLSAKL